MRTSIDIPDETYHSLCSLAEERNETMRQLVLEGLEMVRRTAPKPQENFQIPVISSSRPGSLHLENETLHELIVFP